MLGRTLYNENAPILPMKLSSKTKSNEPSFLVSTMYMERAFFDLEDEYLLCSPNVSLGSFLLDEIMRSGNFGKYDERYINVNRKNGWSVYLHNVKRNMLFLNFCPSEVIWSPIWKPCHYVWRVVKGYM